MRLNTAHENQATDAVWDAVEKAIAAGWSVEKFIAKAGEAWQQTLNDQAIAARAFFAG